MLNQPKIEVLLNKHDRAGRVIGRRKVKAVIIQERAHSLLVKLPDGKIICRSKKRDVVNA